jgi:hypothetical protein
MNPYLEQPGVWETFQAGVLSEVADRLASQVRPDYLVHIEAHLLIRELIEDEFEEERFTRRLLGRADVSVSGPDPSDPRRAEEKLSGSVLTAPARIALHHVDIERQRFLEIRDRRNRSLVAVVELLSPANKKPGPDRDQYIAKRSEILAGPAHLVEIDLIRSGLPTPDEGRPPRTYGIMVSRAEERPQAGFWPIALRQVLPVIPVPLRSAEQATLDLQEILHHVYDRGTYAEEIYDSEPEPALEPADREWAKRRVPARQAPV